MGTDKRARQKAARQAKIDELQDRERKQATKKRTGLIAGGVAIFVVAVIAFSVFTSDDDGDSETVAGDTSTTVLDDGGADEPTTATTNPRTIPSAEVGEGQTECPPEEGSDEQVQTFEAAPPLCIDPEGTYTATIVTDAGDVVVELDAALAPATVNNFVYLARYHYYDGIVFHRVVDDFVIQGGDPTGTGSGGPGYQFQDELPLPSDYQEGSLAMANSGADTNGSQFFIVTSENGAESLVAAVGGRAAYSLFGQVVEGMDVVKAIEADGSAVQHVIETVTITEG